MIRRPVLISILLFVALLVTAGCSPFGVVVGAGATAGVAASEERGIKGSASDTVIRVEISDLWLDEGFDFYQVLEMQIYEGRVLLSGKVPTQAMADTAVRLAWQPAKVHEVINEIVVADGDYVDLAAGSVTAAKLHTELTFTRDVRAINYSIRVVDGVVYLLGVAQNQAELDRVIRTARAIPGIRGVVSHVIMTDDPRRRPQGRPRTDIRPDIRPDSRSSARKGIS